MHFSPVFLISFQEAMQKEETPMVYLFTVVKALLFVTLPITLAAVGALALLDASQRSKGIPPSKKQ